MFITSLPEMEMLVDSRPDIEWDGWDVVRYKKNNNAQFNANGVFKNGMWYSKTVFPLTRDGWSIPNKLVGKDV